MPPARDRVLASALTTFNADGLIGASVPAISKAAKTSVGGIYHHFEGKEGLAGAVYVSAMRSFQDVFAAAVGANPDDAEAGVRSGVDALLDWCLRDAPDAARFLLSASDAARGAAAAELREANREFFARVLAWWRPHVASGALKDLDLDLAHSVWLGPGMEFCRLHLADRTAVDADAAKRALGDAAWNALKKESPR